MSTENGQRILMEDTFMIKFPAKAWGCSINALRVERRGLVDAHVGNLSTAGDMHGDTTKFAATCHLAIAALVSASIPSSRAASSVLRL